MSSQNFDETIRLYAEMMVNKIKQVGFDWEKPWFDPGCAGVPQNLSGRHYQGINSVMLTMEMENKGYETPVFMTAIQASMEHARILKDEKPIEVIYWKHEVRHKETGENISYEKFGNLNKAEKLKYQVTSEMGLHYVYNIQQTEYPKIQPELWEGLKNKFTVRELKDENGMYKSPSLDVMLREQRWICPIRTEKNDIACYVPKGNKEIILPEKGQFMKGEDFYTTLLHEMAHSTGDVQFLNREMNTVFGSKEYAREELIAELTSAVCGKELGIFPNIREENAMYLKSWLTEITDKPEYLFSILAEVGKATYMIKERLHEMNQYMSKEDRFINAALQENRHELQELKNSGFTPSMREIEVLNEQTKDTGSMKAVKEIYNIDICHEIERKSLDIGNNNSRDNGIEI